MLCAAIVVTLLLSIRVAVDFPRRQLRPPEFLPDDHESRYALGHELSFRKIGIAELELIPGVSDTLAQRLIGAKQEILYQAARLPRDQRWRALMLIHGVGKKTAIKLGSYLDLSW